jgi:hypothetical protein
VNAWIHTKAKDVKPSQMSNIFLSGHVLHFFNFFLIVFQLESNNKIPFQYDKKNWNEIKKEGKIITGELI